MAVGRMDTYTFASILGLDHMIEDLDGQIIILKRKIEESKRNIRFLKEYIKDFDTQPINIHRVREVILILEENTDIKEEIEDHYLSPSGDWGDSENIYTLRGTKDDVQSDLNNEEEGLDSDETKLSDTEGRLKQGKLRRTEAEESWVVVHASAEEIFWRFDVNSNGFLNKEEYKNYLQAVGKWSEYEKNWDKMWEEECNFLGSSPKLGIKKLVFIQIIYGKHKKEVAYRDLMKIRESIAKAEESGEKSVPEEKASGGGFSSKKYFRRRNIKKKRKTKRKKRRTKRKKKSTKRKKKSKLNYK